MSPFKGNLIGASFNFFSKLHWLDKRLEINVGAVAPSCPPLSISDTYSMNIQQSLWVDRFAKDIHLVPES